MRGRFLIFLLILAAGTAQADPPPMAAAGVLVLDGRAGCSAVLIAPDLIATAAHCAGASRPLDKDGGDSVIFRTGAYPGHPAREFELTRIAVHPLYVARGDTAGNGIAADLALGSLAQPVPADVARPLAPGAPIGGDASVLLASWPRGKGARARERRCPVLSVEPAFAILSCVVVSGESGGAVVRLTERGPELAAVLVATARSGRQPLGFAVQARSRILQLKAIHGF